jgi:hypothetical protein
MKNKKTGSQAGFAIGSPVTYAGRGPSKATTSGHRINTAGMDG